jgi:ureidoacrylate peracid hydrolase
LDARQQKKVDRASADVALLLDPSRLALIVVDMQNDFVDDEGFFAKAVGGTNRIKQIIPAVHTLVEHARHAGILVVWLRFTSLAHGSSDSAAYPLRRIVKQSPHLSPSDVVFARHGTWGWEICSSLIPESGDVVIDKLRSSGFLGTSLDLILHANDIESVAICGESTDGCVLFTAFDALQLGYLTVVVEDAVADFTETKHNDGINIMARRVDFFTLDELTQVWARFEGSASQGAPPPG